MISKEDAQKSFIGGVLWALGASFVGIAINSWAEKRRENRQIEDLVSAMRREGWIVQEVDE